MGRDWDSKTPTISAEDTTLPGSPNVNLTTPCDAFAVRAIDGAEREILASAYRLTVWCD
jgi:hypothetical protein